MEQRGGGSRAVVVALMVVAAGCAGPRAEAPWGAVIDEEVAHRAPQDEATARIGQEVPDGPPVLLPQPTAQQQESVAEQDELQGTPTETPGRVRQLDLAQLMGKGPAFVLQSVEVEPAREEGHFVGYRIRSMTASAEEALAGRVEVGDVITHLNGVVQRKPEDLLEAWKLMAASQRLRIDFVRDGEERAAVWDVIEE